MSILVLTSDTLIGTPAAGNIEYNGQFFGTDSNASRAQLQRITSGTSVASTSGTSIDFTGLPAWVKRITVMFQGVSTSGTSPIQIQLGAGSVVTSGYTANGAYITTGTAQQAVTTGFPIIIGAAAETKAGALILNLISGNSWVGQGSFSNPTGTAGIMFTAGAVTLSGTLDRVRITTVNGTDTFDAGNINILYEG